MVFPALRAFNDALSHQQRPKNVNSMGAGFKYGSVEEKVLHNDSVVLFSKTRLTRISLSLELDGCI